MKIHRLLPMLQDLQITFSLTARRVKPWSAQMYTCEKCQGSMLLDREVDMESGMSLLVLVCINCGRRKQAEPAPIPLIEAS
jgi:transcription elongation factor Elf1